MLVTVQRLEDMPSISISRTEGIKLRGPYRNWGPADQRDNLLCTYNEGTFGNVTNDMVVLIRMYLMLHETF